MNNIKKSIGIPRAISYYNNYTFYYGFFQGLGIEVVLSDNTTTKLINEGCKLVVSDTCLPIKVFTGHVLNLLEKGCSNIFVPSLQSVSFKVNNCSKIRGLPEIIRNVVNKPFNMIEPTLDKTENIGFKDFCYSIANSFDITDKSTIENAIRQGWKTYNLFLKMAKSGVDYKTAVDNAVRGNLVSADREISKPVSVVIMAHGYNLFDERISLNLIKKLNKLNVQVYTALDIDREDAVNALYNLGEIQYWANELDLTGTAAYFLLNKKVDGIIAVSAFGCGPDSLMVNEIDYHAKEKNMPIMHLMLDEQTGTKGGTER